MKKWLFILVLLAGCLFPNGHLGIYSYTHIPSFAGQTVIWPVYLDINFGEQDKLAIVRALEQWNVVFNGRAQLKMVNDHFDMQMETLSTSTGYFILDVDSTNPLVVAADLRGQEQGGSGITLGFTPFVGSHYIYLVRDRLDNSDVFYLAMHELGHALGAKHTSDGLMYPHYYAIKFQCADLSAVSQVAKFQGLPLNQLNYCY